MDYSIMEYFVVKLTANMDIQEQRLVEYKVLHKKIDEVKMRRDNLLTLTTGIYVGAVVSVLGFSVSNTAILSQTKIQIVAILILYLLVSSSVYMMKSHQRYLKRLIKYIRLNIEPKVPGLNYASITYKEYSSRARKGGLKGLGIYYLVLTLLPFSFYLIFPFDMVVGLPHLLSASISVFLSLDLLLGLTSKGDRQ